MKKNIRFFLPLTVLIAIFLIFPISSFATLSDYELDFKMSSANKSISYDKNSQVLSAKNISVNRVISLYSPLKNGKTLVITSGILSFNFNDLTDSGTISLIGKLPGDSSTSTLFSGIFTSGNVSASYNTKGDLSSGTFDASFYDTISDKALAAFFGLTASNTFSGEITFGFNKAGNFNNTTKSITDTTPAPIPSAVCLLGAGLIGLISVRRKMNA